MHGQRVEEEELGVRMKQQAVLFTLRSWTSPALFAHDWPITSCTAAFHKLAAARKSDVPLGG